MAEPISLPTSYRRYLLVLRRQWWVVVLVTALAIGSATAYVSRQKPVYAASMKVVVGQGQALFSPGLGVDVQPFTQTMTDLLESDVVARMTIVQLGLNSTPTTLRNDLSVTSRASTSVLEVSYHDHDQARAVRILATIGDIFSRLVNQKLAGTAAPPPANGLQSAQPVSATVFDPAHTVPGRVSPKTARTLIIAGLLGLIAGGMLAFLRDALSSQIRNEEEAESAYGAPVIGLVPRGAVGVTPAQVPLLPAKLSARVSEAFALLTARLRYSTRPENGVILITGARPEDGKTTVTAQVSSILARSGSRVIAVEADLRRPALHRFFEIEPGRLGVRDILAHAVPVVDALTPVEFAAAPLVNAPQPHPATLGPAGSDPHEDEDFRSNGDLLLLPAGLAPEDPAHLLSLGNSAEIVSRLRELADYVVIDTPPLLLSGDAFPLVQLADAVLVVCRERATMQEEARRVRETLRSLGVRNYSVVLCESAAAERRPYGYDTND